MFDLLRLKVGRICNSALRILEDNKLLRAENANFRKEMLKLKELVFIDELTGVNNRRGFDYGSEDACAQAKREGTSFCLAMIDTDYFKLINDNHGHSVGDAVLKRLGTFLQERKRGGDVVGRFGGDEFLFLLYGSKINKAIEGMETLRQDINKISLTDPNGQRVSITVTIGVAEWDGKETVAELMDRADKALYRAKGDGRNRVCS